MANRDDEHNDDERRGLTEIARSILDHGADYAEARLELAKLEAGEAADHARGISVRLGIGVFAAIAGYTTTLVAGIALLAHHQFDGRWEVPTLIAGGLHLFIGLIFLIGARRQARQSGTLFSSTLRELNKDKQWLKQKSRPDRDGAARN